MRPRVLILSGVFDFSTDLVALRLHEFGTPFVRLNREHLKEYELTLDPLGQTLSVRGQGLNTEIGPELKSVWYRQPVFLRNTPAEPLSPADQLERSQWAAFIRAMSIFDTALWMNYPRATYLAECKPYQLLAARRCGLKVPKTLVGNDLNTVKSVFDREMVVKSLDTVLLRDKNDCLFTYTTVTDTDALDQESISSVPLLFQEYFADKIDVRLTIVGRKVFAVRILAQGKGIAGDWRTLAKDDLEYVDYQLDPGIDVPCQKLLASLGLSFGAIDLIESDQGTFFVEINPTGEWGWISNSNRQIDLEIASWLTDPYLLETQG